MNLSSARPNLTPEQFEAELWAEYVRENQFAPYMKGGENGMNALIHVNEDLSRKPGDRIIFATVRKLVGAGVSGNQLLEGAEELLDMRSMALQIGVIRHAVAGLGSRECAAECAGFYGAAERGSVVSVGPC